MIQEVNGYTPDKVDEKLRPVAELYILTKLFKKDMSKKEFMKEVKDDLGANRKFMEGYLEDLSLSGDITRKKSDYKISDDGKLRFFKSLNSFDYSDDDENLQEYRKYKELEKTLKNYIILFD